MKIFNGLFASLENNPSSKYQISINLLLKELKQYEIEIPYEKKFLIVLN